MSIDPPRPLDALELYLRKPVSNGHPREQAMIRKWWHEEHKTRGLLVWEYYLEGRYLDAIWFPHAEGFGIEESGASAPRRFPLEGRQVELCEAKTTLTPELVGQALTHLQFAQWAQALVQGVHIFSEVADSPMIKAASALGLRAWGTTGRAPLGPPGAINAD